MATCVTSLGPVRRRQFTILMGNIRKQDVYKKNYHDKNLRRKKQSVNEDKVDINGILRGSGESSGMTAAVNRAQQPSNDIGVQMWQGSQERTTLLRKGEKRVAIFAVVTMLIGFVAIKSMVYVGEKWKTSSDTVEEKPV